MNERILVVDDDSSVVNLFITLLKSAGYEAEGAYGGQEAIERLSKAQFDVLLADVKMPDVDGLEVLRRAKDLDPEIAAVLITGYGTMEMAIKAMQLGAEGFVLKPAEVPHLLAIVAHAVEKRRLIRENIRLKALLPLFEITKRLASEVDLGELNELALDFAVRETGAEGGMVLLRDRASPGTLSLAAARGLPSALKQGLTIPVGEGPIAQVLESNAGRLLVADVEPLSAIANGTGAAWELCVPLSIGDRVLGALDVWGTRRHVLTEDYLPLLSTLAGQLAVTRENALLYQHMENMVEERTRELRRAQEQLLRSERLAAIGQLAASVAHELRHPLGVMRQSAYYLSMKLQDADEKVRKHLNILEKEISASDKIITDLMDFSRVHKPDLTLVDVEKLVDQTLADVETPAGVRVVRTRAPELPPIMADGQQLQQAFRNLIFNAYQAMPDGGTLYITTAQVGEYLEISFQDTGIGIAPAHLEHIFEPLFTTKERGIGLGLTICQNIVEQHQGTIEVESLVGQGTTFTIRLPITPADWGSVELGGAPPPG
ncbi:MAG: response regulator [Anaerolineae bacterium]|nr:response regulator [Anaerolineae bacterium]